MASLSRSRSLTAPLCLVAALGLPACGDNDEGATPDGAPTPDGPPPVDGLVGLAVVNSDFVSTNVSLMDRATGLVANDRCFDSGTQSPVVTLALSGDVVLPTRPQPGNPLVTIDRTNGALTWIDPSSCKPLRQLNVATGFYANPHDVVGISATKAYVLRYERNPTPTADPNDRDEGDDILIIDPSAPAITGRIPLASHAVQTGGPTIQARPDRALLIEGRVYVALSNLSGNFQAAGHGRILVIDPATDQVTGMVDLPSLKNCGGLSYVEATKTLVVACGGAFSDPDQAAGSGIVSIDVGAAPPVEKRRQPATPFGGRALAAYTGVPRDGALGMGVTHGVFGGQPTDQLWALDTAAGTATKIKDALDSFTFGTVLTDPLNQRVYLTDGAMAMPRIHVFDYSGGAPRLEHSINPNASLGLPPREIAWY